jgi:hypothetical protein
MAVLDYDRWDLAVSVDNEYPLYYSLERNLQNEETVIQSLQRWWDTYVVGDCEPNPGSSHLATHYLQARFPAVLVPAQDADPVLEKVGAELSAVLAHIAAFEQRRVSLENLIKLKMGAAEAVIGEFGKVSWRKAGPVTSVNWQKLAEALLSAHYAGRERELVAAFSGITNGNREFRFVPRGKKEFAH